MFSFDSFLSSVTLKLPGNFFLHRHGYLELKDLVLLIRSLEACNAMFLSGPPLNHYHPFLFALCFALNQNSGGI